MSEAREMTTQEESSTQGNQEFQSAGFWKRFAALLVDGLLLFIIQVAWFALFTPEQNNAKPLEYTITDFVFMFMALLYAIVCLKFYGQTLGKKALNLKIIRMDGSPSLTWYQILIREIPGRILSSIFPIVYLMPVFSPEKLALHDHLASTRVIVDR